MSAEPQVAAKHSALQHGGHARTPRPLPLFLQMVGDIARTDPAMAADALAGLSVYAAAPRAARAARTVVATAGRARLLDGGGEGPPVVLVPSLINGSEVLDIDPQRSLLSRIADGGFHALLVDWGMPTPVNADEDIGAHVTALLAPLIAAVGAPVHLVGYCLGGTIALAHAVAAPPRSLTLMAAPWRFAGYPDDARTSLGALWDRHRPSVEAMGLAPIELLQTAFWSLDRHRTVAKFAALSARPADDPSVAAFATVEDWANGGAPLTRAAAQDIFEHMMQQDRPGAGAWCIDGRRIDPASLACPALHFTASNDRIVPVSTAPDAIPTHECHAGHVGMIVGSRAVETLHLPLLSWLKQH